MQPTESADNPSTDVQQPDAQAAAAEPSQASEAQPASAPSWWQRLLGRHEQEPEPQVEETPGQPEATGKRTLTDEEFARAIQSEVDRREAKRRRDDEASQRRKLRDEDPWAYAEQDRQAEANAQQEAQLGDILANISRAHDAVTLDPLMQRLEEADQKRILGLEGAGLGTDGRKLVTEQALAALEKKWRAQGKAEGLKEAEDKLRKNPAFRKQLLSEFNGSSPEPEVLPAGTPRARGRGSDYVNDLFRKQLGIHKEA